MVTTRSASASSARSPFGAVVDDDAQRRREAAGLGLPVVDHGQRAHHEVRARTLEQVGQRGGRLAEAHVVGEAAAQTEAVEEAQPRQAAALVGAQLAVERRRLVLLAQALVGEPAEQLVGPRRGGARRRRVELALAGQAQQRHRVDLGEVANVVLEPLAGPAQRGGIDADPSPAAVQQRGAGAGRPFQLGERQRGRAVVVGHHEAPLHDGLAAEALAVIAAGGRRGPTAQADAGPHQPLRSDELDAAPGQLGRRLLEEPLGRLDVELEGGRLVDGGQLGRRLDAAGQGEGELGDGLGQAGHVVGPTRHLDGERRLVPHVLGGAPAAGVDVVDQFEAHLPVVVGVVGHDEPNAGHDDRLAALAPLVAVEPCRQRGELVGVGEAAAPDRRVGIGERPQDGAGGGERRVAAARQRRAPVVRRQPTAGDGIDHRRVDVGHRRDAVGGEADRRPHGVERDQRGVDRGVGDRGPAGDEHVALLADARGDEPGGDGGRREISHCTEPGQGVRLATLAIAQRAEPAATCALGSRTVAGRIDVAAGQADLDR